MSNRKCYCWLKLRSTEYDVFLVESFKFEQYQFAQVLVTCESTQSVSLLACMIVLMLTLACWMELAGARIRESTQARVQTCIKSVPYIHKYQDAVLFIT